MARPTFFLFGGGPGVSNLGFVPPASWLDVADVVVLEYRGVGAARPLLHSDLFAEALNQPLSGLHVAAAQTVRAGLAAGFQDLRQQGVVFEDYGLRAMASDVEALRQELGLAAIGLVAHSFGTRLAEAVQTLYRDQVRGALLLSLNKQGGLVWYPQQTQSVWTRFQASEAAREVGLDAALLPLLERGWTRAGGWDTGDSRALMLAFFLSFNAGSRKRALSAMVAAQQGSSMAWWLMGAAYRPFVRFAFNWADFFVKGYVVDGSAEVMPALQAQGAQTLFQSPSAILFSAWDGFVAAGGQRELLPPLNLARSLGVIGEFDPSTPIERWPDELPAERRIVLPGLGHADALYAATGHGVSWLAEVLAMDANDGASLAA